MKSKIPLKEKFRSSLENYPFQHSIFSKYKISLVIVGTLHDCFFGELRFDYLNINREIISQLRLDRHHDEFFKEKTP